MNAGDRIRFRYSGNQPEAERLIGADGKPGDPIVSRYTGQGAVLVRPLTSDEADIDDVGPMWRVRFDNGEEHDAFADELETEA